MEKQLSYLSLHRVVSFMRILGLCPIDPNSTEAQHRWHKIYRRGVLFFVVLYIVQQMLKIYEVRDDADKVMATMFLFLTYTDFLYKVIVVTMKYKQIEQVLDITKGPVYNQGEPQHRDPFLKAAKRAVIVGPGFNYMSAFTCFLWSLHPTIQHIQGKLIEFSVWLPFDANLNPQFYVALIYTWVQTTWVAFGNSNSDILIVFLLDQCKIQLSVLRLNLKCVVEKCNNEKSETSQTFNTILERRLKEIIIHYNEIVSMADKIEDIFGGVVFYHFFIGGWIICTAAYSLSTLNSKSVQFLSLIFYILCMLFECGLYCYYGNDVTLESEMLTRSVYEMDWLSISPKHRRTLILFMERCKRPIRPIAGKIIPLSNTTFISIVRRSYSFYAFLKNSRRDI